MNDDVARRIERARALLDFRRPDDARTELRRALADAPDDPRLWGELTRVERIREDHVAAVDAGHRALALDPDQVSAIDMLVTSCGATGRDAEAKRHADRLVELRPEWGRAHLQWAFAHTWWSALERRAQQLHDWPYADDDRARKALERAVELAPDQPDLLADAARCAARLGRPDESQRWITAALELAPTDERVLVTSAELGDERTAVERSLRVLAAEPTSAGAAEQLDRVLWRRIGAPVLFVLVVASATVLGIEAHAAMPNAGTVVLGWVVTAAAVLSYTATVVQSVRFYPASVWRRVLRADPHVAVAVGLASVGMAHSVVTAVTVLVGGGGDAGAAAGTVAAVALVQALAVAVLAVTRAAVDVRADRFPDTPVGRQRVRARDPWGKLAFLAGCAALVLWLAQALVGTEATEAAGRVLPWAWAIVLFACSCASEVLRRRQHRSPVLLVLWATLGTGAAVPAAIALLGQFTAS
ncbi:tetratricopeptide repeat protein [Curtobacterium sp. MCSS17_008]|uniref:tetratricopeptide repeat protein n=1 Tax=Curtobacterium sp. MCSS17_008 TaxID=2175647 RepID=UPI0015E8AE48|nr:tetratricopeptide repeat protein [Curtobacterium sp. MCSS17_008]